ncbi:hypothetical protein HDU93_008920, partial [Gonapodya sp. JEL0774]
MAASKITLACILLGENLPFEVSIDPSSSVNSLKDAIMEELSPSLSDVDAYQLDLWKVDIPYEARASISEDTLKEEDVMKPFKKVNFYFPDQGTEEHIRLVVRRPQVLQPANMRGQEVAYTTRNTAHEIVSFFARNPVASLPSAETLPNLLNQPLPEDAKIPIRQWKLNRLSGDHYSQFSSCTETQLKELFRVDDTSDIEIPNTVDTALIREPPPGSTEASFHYFWDDNIRLVLLFLFGGDAQADRDTSYGTSTGKKRPDFNLIYQNVCVFRGEERARGVDPHKPRNELSANLEWFYWDAPYVFGYYAIGAMVNYVAILSPSAPGTKPAVLDLLNFNLSYRSHRIRNIVFLMNLRRFIDPVRRMVRWSEVPEFTPLENERRILVLRSADVLKTFKGPHHQARLSHLLKVYAKLRKASVPHVGYVRDCTPADRKNVSVASVTPRGIPRLPETEKEGLIAIKCVLETLEVALWRGCPGVPGGG